MIWVSWIIITIYTVGVLIKHKWIPVSLSSTYYSSNKKPWFTITLLITTILMMIPLLDITRTEHQWLVFLSCTGNIFCAFAPNFKEKLEGKIHYIGAVMAGILSQIWCELYNPWTLLLWVLSGVILTLLYIYEKRIETPSTIAFWAELACFFNIYMTYILL